MKLSTYVFIMIFLLISVVAHGQDLGLVKTDDSFFNSAFTAQTEKFKSSIQYLNFKNPKYGSIYKEGDVVRITSDLFVANGFKGGHEIYAGFNYLNSKSRPFERQEGNVNMAYKMKIDSNSLAFGISFGLIKDEFDLQNQNLVSPDLLGNGTDPDLQTLMNLTQAGENETNYKQISFGSSYSRWLNKKLELLTALSLHHTIGDSKFFNVRSIVELKMKVRDNHSLNLLLFLKNQQGGTAYQSQLEFEFGRKNKKLGLITSIGIRKFRDDKVFPFVNFGLKLKRVEGRFTYFNGRTKFDFGSPKFNFGIFYNDITNRN